MRADGRVVEDDTFGFAEVFCEQLKFGFVGEEVLRGEVDRGGVGPGIAAFVRARVDEVDSRLGPVDQALECGEGQLFIAGERPDIDSVERGGGAGESWDRLACGPVDAFGGDDDGWGWGVEVGRRERGGADSECGEEGEDHVRW
ncbi:MAG: hypothetical protein RI897_4041 [Verrucomicrobiota bacterium]